MSPTDSQAPPLGAQPGAAGASSDLESLDRAIRFYQELGFSAERAAVTLVRNGYPSEAIVARFPNVSAQLIHSNSTSRAPALGSRAGQGHVPPMAGTLLDRLLTRSVHTSGAPDLQSVAPKNLQPRRPSPRHALPPQEAALLGTATAAPDQSAISFQYVPLIQCSFPHADQGELSTFTRRNGWLELTLSTARRDVGLPYGVPARLLTIYCASEAIRTRSPEIYLGESVNEFLRRLDVPITRGARGSQRVYANQLLRLIHCAISIDENIRDANGRVGLHIRQALFAEEARLWWDEQSGVGQGSSLILSSVLFDSILERSAPLSTNAIKQLRKSPMDLDVYAWLVHRLYHLTSINMVTWSQLSGQFGHGYTEPRKFRHFFLDSLKRVQAVYPEARLKLADGGLMLMPSKPHVARPALARR
jgi:replication initiator protein